MTADDMRLFHFAFERDLNFDTNVAGEFQLLAKGEYSGFTATLILRAVVTSLRENPISARAIEMSPTSRSWPKNLLSLRQQPL